MPTAPRNPSNPQRRPPTPAGKAAAPHPAGPERICPRCGFGFRGKSQTSCPHCSAPLATTSDLLQLANPAWVRTTALGLLIMVPGIALHLFGCIFAWTGPQEAKGLAHALGALLLTLGIFLATRAQTGVPAVNRGPAIAARLLALASMAIWLFLALVATGIYVVDHINKPAVLVILLIQGPMCIALAFHCAHLAYRLPNDSLAGQANYTGWFCSFVCAGLFVIQGLEMTKGYFPMFFMFSFPIVGGMTGILVWTMITLVRLALDMRISTQPPDLSHRARPGKNRPSQTSELT